MILNRSVSLSDQVFERIEEDILTDEDVFEETVMLGLRTSAGIPSSLLASKKRVLDRLVESGLLVLENGRVRATEKGADVLNAVILELVS